MNSLKFIGRKAEINALNDLLSKKTSSLVVVKGRRRIGKSRLIEEFAKKMVFYHFSGLAPIDGIIAQDQKNEFSLQLSQQTNIPELQVNDWTKLFLLLADKCKKGRVVILFDEITWMADGDPTFLAKLKNVWDMYLKKNPQLILILCGSVSAWIEKNIISSTGYFGRVSLSLTLHELPIDNCNQLLESLGFCRSSMEKLMILSLTGGVPWYLEQINPKYSAIENIRNLCFKAEGLLVKEYRHIFHDLFGRRSEIYQKITKLLSAGDLNYDEIASKLNYAKSSALSEYLDALILSGYLTQYNRWSLKTGRPSSKLKKYRLSDNFLRFYFRYMSNKLPLIESGAYATVSPENLPGWRTILGLQFENLVLQNRAHIYKSLSINFEDVIASGPYFQRRTARQKGCQIDYLIQTKYRTLFVCEIKFSQNSIGLEVVDQTKEKIARLSLPRGYAVIPVLIHTSKMTEAVYDANYFVNVVNFSDYL